MAQQQEQRTGDSLYHLKTILLVEDDTNIGEVLVQAITQETSYLAVLASDGFEALKCIENLTPNLFILDYQLPRMNGIELYDKLHAIDKLANVPTIMMSARLPQQELAKRSITPMNKPIDLDDFLQTIDQLLIQFK
jgi:DNA-binding response OmpR family regulator